MTDPTRLPSDFFDLTAEEGLYPSQITVYCDDCGTEVTGDYVVHTDMDRTARLEVARDHLRDQGWYCADGIDLCPDCQPTTGAPAMTESREIVYAVTHPRPDYPGETWRPSYGTRTTTADLPEVAAEVAADTRAAHRWDGPLTVSIWEPRPDEHYRQPIPDAAAVFHFPAVTEEQR